FSGAYCPVAMLCRVMLSKKYLGGSSWCARSASGTIVRQPSAQRSVKRPFDCVGRESRRSRSFCSTEFVIRAHHAPQVPGARLYAASARRAAIHTCTEEGARLPAQPWTREPSSPRCTGGVPNQAPSHGWLAGKSPVGVDLEPSTRTG